MRAWPARSTTKRNETNARVLPLSYCRELPQIASSKCLGLFGALSAYPRGINGSFVFCLLSFGERSPCLVIQTLLVWACAQAMPRSATYTGTLTIGNLRAWMSWEDGNHMMSNLDPSDLLGLKSHAFALPLI